MTISKARFSFGAIAVVLLLLIGACSSGAKRDEPGRLTEEADILVEDLRAGDCFNQYKDPLASSVDLSAVSAVPCSAPHAFEVYHELAVGKMTDEWPGDAALSALAEASCIDAFEPFVGASYEASRLDFGFFFPSPDSWRALDRDALCYLVDPMDAEVVGSLRDTRQ
jgi:hypothetical protein